MSKLVVFNRCESTTGHDVVNSLSFAAIGSPSVVAGKWGNAVYSNGNPAAVETNGTFDSALTSNWTKFAISMFVKSNNTITAGVPQSGGGYNSVFALRDATDTTAKIVCDFQSNGMFFQINGPYWLSVDARIALTAGGIYHLGFVGNSAGIAGSADTLRLYINNTLSGTSALVYTGYSSPVILHFLNDYGNEYTFDGWEDNIKIYDYDKTDFLDDMHNERSGLADQILM